MTRPAIRLQGKLPCVAFNNHSFYSLTAVFPAISLAELRPFLYQPQRSNVSVFYKVNRWAQQVVDIMLPPRCASCQRVGAALCASCVQALVWVEEPICPECGQPQEETAVCNRCRRRPLSLHIRAALRFRATLPETIHQFKYYKKFGLASHLADLMVRAWPQWAMPVDWVLPIPLHAERRRERGYNQSALLAHHLAAQLGLPMSEKVLRRVRPTQVQARLTAEERLHNVQGAFSAEPNVAGRRVLLIDDVCTTGSTLEAAAQTLLGAGALSVAAYCLARA